MNFGLLFYETCYSVSDVFRAFQISLRFVIINHLGFAFQVMRVAEGEVRVLLQIE